MNVLTNFFYRQVRHFNTIYEVNEGVYIPSVEARSKNDIGKILSLYENLDAVNSRQRYLALVEVFVQPKDMGKRAAGYDLGLYADIDVSKN